MSEWKYKEKKIDRDFTPKKRVKKSRVWVFGIQDSKKIKDLRF